MTAKCYFRWLLALATATSLAGNVAHVIVAPADGHTSVAIAVAAVAPLALCATVHGIAVAVRAGVSGAAYRLVLAAVGVIAASAFALSWQALTALAVVVGYRGWTAGLLPVVVDATVAVATAMLVVLDRPARAAGGVHQTASGVVHRPAQVVPARVRDAALDVARVAADAAPAAGHAPVLNPTDVRPAVPDVPPAGSTAAAPDVGLALPASRPLHKHAAPDVAPADVAHQAARLVHQRVTRLGTDTVVAVLTRAAAGETRRAICRSLGVDPRTVSAIVTAAAEVSA